MDEQGSEAMAMIEEASAEYLGKWNRLVSTTNWEKGRIICQWRDALQEAGAAAASYTDDTWSRQVGSVSPQHVGRLRRVYQQFGDARAQYPGLYWSHFQAALEWPDPEMWLEGAVQNGWSVAQMRQQRGEATGMAPEAAAAAAAEAAVVEELDEDAGEVENSGLPSTIVPSTETVRDPAAENDEADDESTRSERPGVGEEEESAAEEEAAVRPFENLAPLPTDLAEAVERFKLAIVHHRIAGWHEVSCQHVLDALEALKELALAPADSSAPF